MHKDGLIVLSAPQGRQGRPRAIVFGPDTEPPLFPAPTTLDEVRPLNLRPVVRGTHEGKLWNENLGSHILAIVRRRLPEDWAERYNTTPVLIETFVQTPPYTGAVYRASGWINVGATQGRGRYDWDRRYDEPKKDVWLRQLQRDWKRTLNR